MTTKRLLRTSTAIAVLGLGASLTAATAAQAATPEAVSQNWSGYAAGGNTQFSDVAGSWVQPTAKCNAAGQTYSAFWVGLGGSSDQSQALEQVGTQSDCGAGGQTDYYAWYELVPAAPVKLGLEITPGDKISAKVSVSGSSVTVSLTDQSTGQGATKTLSMSNPDTSTAEWIAEAPSECDGSASGNCQTLTLANFGSVAFSNATATAGGHTGTISDSNWTAQAVQLSAGQTGLGGGFTSASSSSASSAGAHPRRSPRTGRPSRSATSPTPRVATTPTAIPVTAGTAAATAGTAAATALTAAMAVTATAEPERRRSRNRRRPAPLPPRDAAPRYGRRR